MAESYRIPLGDWIEDSIDFLITHLSPATRLFASFIETWLNVMESALNMVPIPALIAAFCLIAWRSSRNVGFIAFTAIGFFLIWNMELWEPALSTLTLVFVAAFLAVSVGVPLGIMAAIMPRFRAVVMPLLDGMQTMPAFVYLIPAIPFFGIGKVSAVFATIVFAMPPAIRLTYLGIKGVPAELVECAEAFGSTRWQRLRKLEIPLAMPTIMAGVNQTVLLALSMVVIAAMIGARGLGGEVWRAIQRLDLGSGFEAGLGIVIIAIYLDRILQAIGRRQNKKLNNAE